MMQCHKSKRITAGSTIKLVLMLLITSSHAVYGGKITLKEYELEIQCQNDTLETMASSIMRHSSTSFRILQCPPPNGSYADVLEALNLDVSALNSLSLRHVAINELREEQFHGLPLQALDIWNSNSFQYNFDAEHTVDDLNLTEPDILGIFCSNDVLENRTAVFHRTVKATVVHIYCTLPVASYQTALRALNIDTDTISYLRLFITSKPALRSSYLTGIHLNKLLVKNNRGYSLNYIDSDIFQNMLPTLKAIELGGVVMPTLPESSQIADVDLSQGRSIGAWGGCSQLKRMKLKAWEIPATVDDEGWLAHCPQLTELELEQITRPSLERAVTGTHALTSLIIKDSFPFEFTDNWLTNATKLKKIVITKTRLDDTYSVAFPTQTELEELELTNNLLVDFDIYEVLAPVKSLRNLTLDNNFFINFCINRISLANGGNHTLPPTLKRISMSNSIMKDFCFKTWNSLQYLDISSNSYKNIQFTELPTPHDAPIVVNLRNNSIYKFIDSEEEYDVIYEKYKEANNLTILMDDIMICDCNNAWFARLLRSLPNVRFEHATCTSGELLEHVPPKQLECDKYPCEGCTCRTSWHDNTTAADCNGAGLNAMPRIPNLRTLTIRQNNIETFNPKDFPETLLSVDLRYNRIAHMSAEVVAALFSQPARRVWLGGESLVCDCENQPLIEALQKYHIQVMDYEDLTCVDNGTPVSDVVIESLCYFKLDNARLILLVVSAGLLVLIIIAAVVYYRYRSQIKVFLYIRGYCLCCVQEEELDLDRPYDAFVSFSHEDESFVIDKLLPELEGNSQYKLCVHSRDWIPGESIPAQIVSSVQQSRRTVIVLSKSFVNSMWAMLEFRTAYTSALQEKRVRLVIVVLDDVISDSQLDPELKNYLNINTYVKWRDPWFWQKLLYALPHRRKEMQRRISTRNLIISNVNENVSTNNMLPMSSL